MTTETCLETTSAQQSCLAQAIDMVEEAVVVMDRDTVVLSVNTAFERITGYSPSEVLGHKLQLLEGVLGDQGDASGPFTRGEPWSGRLTCLRKGGAPYLVAISIAPVRDARDGAMPWVATLRDDTQRSILEAQFRQAQKMEAIGRLAAGIAHDFNNQLTVIQGYCDLVTSHLPAGDPTRGSIDRIRGAAVRSAALTGRLLSLSRKHAAHPTPTNLNRALQDAAKSLAPIIGEDIRLSVLPDEDPGLVEIDGGLFDQAVMNLVINARDAMPHGGQIELATARVGVGQTGRPLCEAPPPGEYIRLTVSDTGAGIDREALPHIFDAFYTTKAEGQGTGLGLAMVYGLVKQSRGFIYVESTPGKGTKFTLYFHYTKALAAASEGAAAVLPGKTGTETVLVAEDDEELRSLSARVLGDCGYSVLAAGSGREALSIGLKHTGRIDLLITDVVMPDMSGPALAVQFGVMHGEARVLYVSGYPPAMMASHGWKGCIDNLLTKPYDLCTLADKARQTIDGRATPPKPTNRLFPATGPAGDTRGPRTALPFAQGR